MNVQPQKSGEEVEAFFRRLFTLSLFESGAICSDDIGVRIREVAN
jgi:hypothetical protein